MLTTSAVLFAIAALGGIIIAFRDQDQRPMTLSIIHGLVAASGLGFLVYAVIQGAMGTLPLTALCLFVITALGGFVLFALRLRGRQQPRGLIYLHGFLAVIAEVLLILAIL